MKPRKPLALHVFLLLSVTFGWMVRPLQGASSAKQPQNSAPSPKSLPSPPACKAMPGIQSNKVAHYETEKDAIVDQFRSEMIGEEPKRLLKIAEDSFKDYRETGCEEYFFESIFLYKTYYDVWQKYPQKKHPVNCSTQKEYRLWTDRFKEWNKAEEINPISLYPRPNDFFLNLIQFTTELNQEKKRVDQLIRKRNQIMIPSVVSMALGVSLIIAGSILHSLDGTVSSQPLCKFRLDGEEKAVPCSYHYPPAMTGVMIGFGIAFTVGGATGLGISLFQANRQSSPALP